MSVAAAGVAFVAGSLSTLSPCVLPLLPIVFSTALSKHKFGPLALSTGVAFSFLTIGMFVAIIGYAIGLNASVFRIVGAGIMLFLGMILVIPSLQARVAYSASALGDGAQARFARFAPDGIGGQFAVGLILGLVWTPCAGPTLGAASILASRGQDLWQVSTTMLAFSAGTTVSLVLVGALSQRALTRWRGRLFATGAYGKTLLGIMLVAFGALILTGFDKHIETLLVNASPPWLSALTTRY